MERTATLEQREHWRIVCARRRSGSPVSEVAPADRSVTRRAIRGDGGLEDNLRGQVSSNDFR